MLEDFLSRNHLFSSDTMDLTNNFQKTFKRFDKNFISETNETVKSSCKNYMQLNKNFI
jgi:hypothetical protein